jgi:hypothetical protein
MPKPNGSRSAQRRQRQKSPPEPPPANPLQVLAKARATPPPSAPVEEPLAPHEVVQLKRHFKFLREHRNVLKLRVNAAEDLLLNGVKEPTHRGVCQHLLAKVERSRVLSVSQTLPAADAVRLLSGVIQFAPEIGYILRFLECVKLTSTHEQAGAAITEALKGIEFTDLSGAQMRQLVSLIVEVFPEREIPIFLLTLLNDRTFREALDRSLDGFPEVLRTMVRPLFALHGVLAPGRGHSRAGAPNVEARRFERDDVLAGVVLVLAVNSNSLLRLSESTRRRLFHLGCEALRARQDVRRDALESLLTSLSFNQPSEQRAATELLVSALLATGHDVPAKRILDLLPATEDTQSTLSRWRSLLAAPRVGPIAMDASRPGEKQPPPERWQRGWHVPSQSSVLFRFGAPESTATYQANVALWRSVLIPATSRVVAAGTDDKQRPFLAVEIPGSPLPRCLSQGARVTDAVRTSWMIGICALLNALGREGLALPDASLYRYNVDSEGHVWLVDLWQVRVAEPTEALALHVKQALDLCNRMLGLDLSPTPEAEGIETATGLRRIVEQLERRRSA